MRITHRCGNSEETTTESFRVTVAYESYWDQIRANGSKADFRNQSYLPLLSLLLPRAWAPRTTNWTTPSYLLTSLTDPQHFTRWNSQEKKFTLTIVHTCLRRFCSYSFLSLIINSITYFYEYRLLTQQMYVPVYHRIP